MRCTQHSSDLSNSHNTLTKSKYPNCIAADFKTQGSSSLLLCRSQSKLSFLTFHTWFEEFVPGWIKLSREKCESRIEQAIQLDEIVKITNDLKLSTSAVDTRGFLHQTAAFWQHLDWPVASEAYGFAVSMIENMCCCAEFYVGKIFGSLNSESLQDEHGRFKASEKVSVLIPSLSLSLSLSLTLT